jgi:hypothetical protein
VALLESVPLVNQLHFCINILFSIALNVRSTATIMAGTVDAKLLKATKFPPEFNQKVDMQKVNVEVLKKYV